MKYSKAHIISGVSALQPQTHGLKLYVKAIFLAHYSLQVSVQRTDT